MECQRMFFMRQAQGDEQHKLYKKAENCLMNVAIKCLNA